MGDGESAIAHRIGLRRHLAQYSTITSDHILHCVSGIVLGTMVAAIVWDLKSLFVTRCKMCSRNVGSVLAC